MDMNELEADISKAIRESTAEVFSTMLMMEVKSDDSFIKEENNVSTDMISSLHFFGNKYMGKIAVFSSGAVSCHIANAMLGGETESVDDEVKDGMGEIVNMIAGSAKVKLNDTLGDIHLLTPWVIAGRHLSIKSSEGGDELSLDSLAHFSWIMTKFTFEKGSFLVGVQPNAVPEEDVSRFSTKDDVDALKAENKKLQSEIEQLKSQLDNNTNPAA